MSVALSSVIRIMIEQDSLYQRISIAPERKRTKPKYPWMGEWWFRLLALLFLAELFVPFLRWPLGFPKVLELAIHGFAGLILLATIVTMLKEDRIPKGVLVILGITLIWGVVSLVEGQSFLAFGWGWYQMFRYPLIGLFAYMTMDNPKDFARWFIRFSLALLMFQVGVQIIMYAMGFGISDNTGGTFGQVGVAKYGMMIFLVNSMLIGHWLATRDLKYLALSLLLGLIGSALSELKFYIIGVAVMLGIAAIIQLTFLGRIRQFVVFLILFLIIGTIFIPVTNYFLLEIGESTLDQFLQDDYILNRYLFAVTVNPVSGQYYLGRGQSLVYSWQQIQHDMPTALFGFGLGSRTSSSLLGVGGVKFQEDLYGGVTLSSGLATWMQEYGLVGLTVFLLMAIWINMQLFRFLRRFSDPYQRSLVLGLIVYTSCWPVWLFYADLPSSGIMAIMYCVAIGYIFRQAHDRPRHLPAR